MLSQGEKEAWDLLDKCHFIWDNLPDFLKEPLKNDTKSKMGFSNGSIIEALPSTDKAGRSTDATLVIRDELANHPYGEENFLAISPTIDSGARLIDLSTINKLDSENHFTQRINKANNDSKVEYPFDNKWMEVHTGGESGATLIFCGWRLRPVRDEGMTLDDWFNLVIKKKYEPFEIEQEYPSTLEEALSTPQTVCRFNIDTLNAMLKECIEPIRTEYEGHLLIYKEPIAGRRYCMIADSSSGEVDPSVCKVIDSMTNDVAACVKGKIVVNEQARIEYDLYERYFEPFTSVERNAGGVLLVDKLVNMGITNWYFIDPARKKPGWYTSGNRGAMIEELADWVRNRNFREPDKEAVGEFRSFVRTPKNPDGAAIGGKHDDHVMTWAIYSQVRKKMPVPSGRVKSYSYRQR